VLLLLLLLEAIQVVQCYIIIFIILLRLLVCTGKTLSPELLCYGCWCDVHIKNGIKFATT